MEEPKEEPPFRWLENVITPPEGFAVRAHSNYPNINVKIACDFAYHSMNVTQGLITLLTLFLQATGLLILELPGFRNLKTADLLAVLRVCPSLERLDLTHSAGFSHLEVHVLLIH